jgi:hypothetical protein
MPNLRPDSLFRQSPFAFETQVSRTPVAGWRWYARPPVIFHKFSLRELVLASHLETLESIVKAYPRIVRRSRHAPS